MTNGHDRSPSPWGSPPGVGACRLAACLALTAPLLGACAFGPAASGAQATEIVFTGAGFEPATVTVEAGTEIRFHNGDTSGVAVTLLETEAPDAGGIGPAWSTPTLVQGESFSHRVDTPGSYVYGTEQSAAQALAVVHVEGP